MLDHIMDGFDEALKKEKAALTKESSLSSSISTIEDLHLWGICLS